ncbi:MAG: HigA family addiction module antidote protein [Rhodospirillales bacterium]|nr:HigA family addiction module antidote protein [Rhodospirillales bacterium]
MTSKSSITIKRRLKNWHPGEILLEDFLKPMGLSQYALAKAIGVPAQRVGEIVHAKRAVSPDTALRLARYFGMDAAFWLNLQMRFDLEEAERTLSARVKAEVIPRAA